MLNTKVLDLRSLNDLMQYKVLCYLSQTASRRNVIFATTRHGGHLGYFEGGFVVPNTVTWIDRLIIQYCDAIAAKNHHVKQNGY